MLKYLNKNFFSKVHLIMIFHLIIIQSIPASIFKEGFSTRDEIGISEVKLSDFIEINPLNQQKHFSKNFEIKSFAPFHLFYKKNLKSFSECLTKRSINQETISEKHRSQLFLTVFFATST